MVTVTTMQHRELVNARELATRLRVTYATVLSWVNRGIIPFLRGSQRQILFDEAKVREALKQRARRMRNDAPLLSCEWVGEEKKWGRIGREI